MGARSLRAGQRWPDASRRLLAFHESIARVNRACVPYQDLVRVLEYGMCATVMRFPRARSVHSKKSRANIQNHECAQ